jgi:hypothetical protein
MLYNIWRRLVGADKIPLPGFSGVFTASSPCADTSLEPSKSCKKVLRLLFVVTISCLLLWIFAFSQNASQTGSSGISAPADN